MMIDIHAHMFGYSRAHPGNYIRTEGRHSFVYRLLLRQVRSMTPPISAHTSDDGIQKRILSWIQESSLDRVVLLALDGAWNRDGTPDMANTRLVTDNDYVADTAARSPKALFGASIHPFRPDALDQLDRLASRGACLVKWLPSAQNIPVNDPACFPFYDRLVSLQIPLLTHTGIEHTLPTFDQSLNHPRRLRVPLERGVVVIAAHCATRMFLHEPSAFPDWCDMALAYPNLFGDLAGFGLQLHGGPLRRIQRDSRLLAKVLHASDFPAHSMPFWHFFRLGRARCQQLHGITNPLDRAYMTMKALDLPDEVFSRAAQLLRIPTPRPTSPSIGKGATREHA